MLWMLSSIRMRKLLDLLYLDCLFRNLDLSVIKASLKFFLSNLERWWPCRRPCSPPKAAFLLASHSIGVSERELDEDDCMIWWYSCNWAEWDVFVLICSMCKTFTFQLFGSFTFTCMLVLSLSPVVFKSSAEQNELSGHKAKLISWPEPCSQLFQNFDFK